MFNGFKKRAGVAAIAVAAGLGSTQSASAGVVAPSTVTLDSLLEGGRNEGGITVGDKLYDNFIFSSTGQGRLDADEVEVIIAIEGNQHFVAFLFDLASLGTARSDLVIGYDLHVLDPARHIESVGLIFDGAPAGSFSAPSAAATSVIETVTTLDGSDLAPGGANQATEIITVFNDGDEGLEDNFETTLAINPARGLRFVKDIMVSSRGQGASDITTVENSVTQNGTVIPLPAAFWAAMPVMGALMAGKKARKLARRN